MCVFAQKGGERLSDGSSKGEGEKVGENVRG